MLAIGGYTMAQLEREPGIAAGPVRHGKCTAERNGVIISPGQEATGAVATARICELAKANARRRPGREVPKQQCAQKGTDHSMGFCLIGM